MTTVSFTTSGALGKSALRQANERLVLNAIRREPGISRAAIARATGLARTSVTFVVNRLLQDGLVLEEKVDSSPAPTAGRPPTSLHLEPRAKLAVGVQVRPEASRAVLADLTGAMVAERDIAWDANPTTYLDRLENAVRLVTEGYPPGQILGIGISLPGTIDKVAGRVIGAEGLGWFNVPAGDMLRPRLSWPVYFENDANLAALAEQWFLPAHAEALRYFVYVQGIGGLGTGVVVDGRILHGAASAGTEFGHVMLDPYGRPCRCGNRGCWEQYASDAALVRAYAAVGGATVEPHDAMDVVRLARGGDGLALHAVRDTASFLALGLVNLVVALNPQAIVLGEPFRSAWDLMKDVVEQELHRRLPVYSVTNLRLLPAREGANASLLGAAAIVLASYFTSFDAAKTDSLPGEVVLETAG
ncbi:MAG: ROK family transcriptional regulator [Bryobacterales bacterium]|nr:ROK family transcriptional regulator [Bryobacterales bacterium]